MPSSLNHDLPRPSHVLLRSRWLAAATSVAAVALGLAAHWPSDVVASMVIGAAVLLVTEHLLGSTFAARHARSCALHAEASSR